MGSSSVFHLFLQLLLAVLAVASPVGTRTAGIDSWQYGAGGGIVGFIVLVLDVIVLIEVLKSDRLVSHKLLWCVVVFLFPVVGIIIYWLFSNRAAHNKGYEPIV